MRTGNSFILSSLCMLIFSCVLASSDTTSPDIFTESTVVSVEEGSTAVLKCRVSNPSSHTVSWTFVTHDVPIFKGRELLANDPSKYSVISPLDSQIYNLMLLGVEKSDHGFYRCAVDETNKSVTILLQVEGKSSIPFVSELLNRTDCCVEEGVAPSCLPVCSPSSVDVNIFDVDNCNDTNLESLAGLTKCLTANSNHDNCCLFRGLDPLCLPFCHNEIPDDLSVAHLETCLSQGSIDILVHCFAVGFESLPDEPQDVTVLPSTTDQSASLVVTWGPPERNADKVTGYKIMYRRDDKTAYFSQVIHDPTINRYRLTGPNLIVNMGYRVHVAALADHGVSVGSVEISVFIPDDSLSQEQNQLISDCCTDRRVSSACNSLLCRSRTWSHFNFDSVVKCLPHVNHIFTCLVGERDHTSCCVNFGVSPVCQPLCSGHPPPFNESLIICTHELGTIEACAQQGYNKLPAPPSTLHLTDVTSRTATLTFKTPSSTVEIKEFIVELHEGYDEDRSFRPFMTLTRESESVFLDNLKPNTYYGVRIITLALVDNDPSQEPIGSLPSDSVYFLTYPASFEEPTVPPVVNIPNDFRACCERKGMPEDCSNGCQYVANITSYYASRLPICYNHIGSVLSCGADGRDHSPCCQLNGIIDPECLDLCRITVTGSIPASAGSKCIQATPIAMQCYIEGIGQTAVTQAKKQTYRFISHSMIHYGRLAGASVNLPRHPDVVISNFTWNSISLEWEQPATSGLIDNYIVLYGVESESQRTMEKTNRTHLILNNLKSATAYTITVSSENENGTSVPSPIITQYTLQEKSNLPVFNESVKIGEQLWKNISDCCMNSGIPPECLDLCLNKQIQNPDASCVHYSTKMLACYADGQDHKLCCSRKPQLPEICHAICSGNAPEQNPYTDSCMSYGSRTVILSCFLENSALIPGAPRKLGVKVASSTSVDVVWLKSDSFCGDDCSSVILYWKINPQKPDDKDVKTIKNAESPYKLAGLDTESFYTFAVRAENTHGTGLLSNLETLYLSGYRRDVKVTIQRNDEYVDIGQDVALTCSAYDFDPNDPYTLKWFFNNGRELEALVSNEQVLVITKVDPIKDEGTYSCVITDSVETNSDEIFLPIKYAPTGAEIRDDTASPGIGEQAILACWFNGFPDTDADHWQKDGEPLGNDSTKYSTLVSRRYHTGITSYRLKIANLVEADYGKYSIEVANKFGQTSCTVKLQDPADIRTIIPAERVFNGTECCAKNGVTELCQDLCGFHVDIAEIVDDSSYITCLAYFDIFIKCGADGRDHTTCCKKKGIKPYCFPFCAGQTPGSVIIQQEELLQCLDESSDIFSCMQSGHKLLPFPPRMVIVSWWASGRNVMVRWSKPLHNFDKIDHYYVHYRAGNDTEVTHTVNEQIQEFEIKNADKESDYFVFVTARNKWGYSQNSETAVLKAIAIAAPSYLTVLVTGKKATLTWANSPATLSSFDSYNVYYKMANFASFRKISGVSSSTYTFLDLKEKTTYMAYVTTQSKQGHESGPSMKKLFTTGENISPDSSPQSDDETDNKVAIGVGVVVAIFALAAIIFLVIYLVKIRQVHKRNNDTVTFENPGYGNQGSVKIQGVSTDDSYGYGRLDEDRTYDNIAEVSPTDVSIEERSEAYANPTYAAEENSESNIATLPVNSEV